MSSVDIRCPFHQDDTPSCSVDVARGVWHCHGCHRSGLLYDLARACGCSVKDAMDRNAVMQTLGLHAQTSAHTMMLPVRAVHDSEQIRKMWTYATPSPFGLGYPLARGVDRKLLMAFGVDYMCGLVLFRRWANAHAYWSDELAQVREAAPGGRYYSVPGRGTSGLRCVFSPTGAGRPVTGLNLVLVEGPFDALAVLQAIGVDWMNEHDVYVAATCGTALPEDHPSFARAWTLFDRDAAGRALADRAPWATPIPIVAEDPAAESQAVLKAAVMAAIEGVRA